MASFYRNGLLKKLDSFRDVARGDQTSLDKLKKKEERLHTMKGTTLTEREILGRS